MARLSIRARAGLMSFLLPGLGHVYLGRFGRAAIWFVGLLVLAGITGSESAEPWLTPVVGSILAICSGADAAIIAPRGTRRP